MLIFLNLINFFLQLCYIHLDIVAKKLCSKSSLTSLQTSGYMLKTIIPLEITSNILFMQHFSKPRRRRENTSTMIFTARKD